MKQSLFLQPNIASSSFPPIHFHVQIQLKLKQYSLSRTFILEIRVMPTKIIPRVTKRTRSSQSAQYLSLTLGCCEQIIDTHSYVFWSPAEPETLFREFPKPLTNSLANIYSIEFIHSMCTTLLHGDGDETNTHLELPEVAFEVARVNGQILPRSELRGIHIYRDHHLVGALLRFLDEWQVTAVKKPHRGNERNSVPGLPLRARPLAHCFLLPNYLHRCPIDSHVDPPPHNLQDPRTEIRKEELLRYQNLRPSLVRSAMSTGFRSKLCAQLRARRVSRLNLERCDSVQSRRPRSTWMTAYIQWMNFLLCSSEGNKGHAIYGI